MDMLIESVVAANAAFALIKTTINNGKDLHACGKALGVYLGHKDKIIAEVKSGRNKNDLDAFMELEKLKKQEIELKFLMNKTRLNMYAEYLDFVRSRNLQRAKTKQSNIKSNKAKTQSNAAEIKIALLVIGIILFLAVGGAGMLYYKVYF